jgi:hypothetical protein
MALEINNCCGCIPLNTGAVIIALFWLVCLQFFKVLYHYVNVFNEVFSKKKLYGFCAIIIHAAGK